MNSNRLYNIDNTFGSYQQLISFYEANKDKLFETISLELSQWFAANMSAALGAVLDALSAGFINDVRFDFINSSIETILLKNDFLTFYGKERIIDFHNTTIKYQKLKPTDGKYFKTYIIEDLIENHITDFPKMSIGAKEKIVEAIYEIFVNSQIHSETDFIYTCGQFFPKKNKIEFTIVDRGIGFKEKVNQRFNRNLTSMQAIKWAVQDKNTTKENISGGIGLAVLREFVEMNKGKMQIISGDGFYQYTHNEEEIKQFKGEFPGTIVNLQFKTDDNHNYLLKSELNIDDIF